MYDHANHVPNAKTTSRPSAVPTNRLTGANYQRAARLQRPPGTPTTTTLTRHFGPFATRTGDTRAPEPDARARPIAAAVPSYPVHATSTSKATDSREGGSGDSPGTKSPMNADTDTAPVPGSRSWKRAFDDIRTGLRQRELWGHLGWQDIKQRYRRSVIGPFWLTITQGVIALGLGLLYSQLFGLPIETFLPYIVTGFIVWNFISGCIT